MKTIWKYAINPMTSLQMPKGAVILSVATQDNQPQMWALVDPGAEKVNRRFQAVPTGMEFSNEKMVYIGTVHVNDGTLVFHIFEEIEKLSSGDGESA